MARVRDVRAERGRRAGRPQPAQRRRNSSTPRGTAPAFTPDGKFVVFTIAQSKADEEREAAANRGAERETPRGANRRRPAQAQAARGGRGAAARTPRTGLGIMTLADGQVKTFDKVGSFSLPEKSSDVARVLQGYSAARGGGGRGGRGGAGGRGGGARRRTRRGAGGGAAGAAAARPQRARSARSPAPI